MFLLSINKINYHSKLFFGLFHILTKVAQNFLHFVLSVGGHLTCTWYSVQFLALAPSTPCQSTVILRHSVEQLMLMLMLCVCCCVFNFIQHICAQIQISLPSCFNERWVLSLFVFGLLVVLRLNHVSSFETAAPALTTAF